MPFPLLQLQRLLVVLVVALCLGGGTMQSSRVLVQATPTTTATTVLDDGHPLALERYSLQLLFDATLGATSWTNTEGWTAASADTHWNVCAWYGVDCIEWETGVSTTTATDETSIVALDLSHNGLVHAIPATVWSGLTRLTHLNVRGNALGSIEFDYDQTPPPLVSVDASANVVTSIASWTVLHATLQHVQLDANPLAVPQLPTELYALTQLQHLSVNAQTRGGGGAATDSNSSIPAFGQPSAIANWTHLQELHGYDNGWQGRLPTELGALPLLQTVSLSHNAWTGPIPTEFNNLRNLQLLSLHSNTRGLTGPIPSLANSPYVTQVLLSHNRLSGTLPHDWLWNNRHKVTGTSSTSTAGTTTSSSDATTTTSAVRTVPAVVTLDVSDNALTGGLPEATLRSFPRLQLDVSDNRLTIPIPDELCAKGLWQQGLVATLACPALACPRGTHAPQGRQVDANQPCQPCPLSRGTTTSADFFLGATHCPGPDHAEPNTGNPTNSTTTTTRVLTALWHIYTHTNGPHWERNEGWNVWDQWWLDFDDTTNNDKNNPHIEWILSQWHEHQVQAQTGGQSTQQQALYCSWTGITCQTTGGPDGEGIVEYLDLADNRLHGTLPVTELWHGLSDHLISLNVGGNPQLHITHWTSSSTTMTSVGLQRLDASHTTVHTLDGLDGAVFSNLTVLRLNGMELLSSSSSSDNSLDAWPTEHSVGSLSSLEHVYLNGAHLRGTLPPISNWSRLQTLELQQNELRGPISGLQDLPQLLELDLSDNAWTGTLTNDQLPLTLQRLRIAGSRGGLGGPLPSLAQHAQLTLVDLSWNQFTGPLPVDFLQAAAAATVAANPQEGEGLRSVNLADNALTGTLPSEWASTLLSVPMEWHLQDNHLTNIPDVLCTNASLWNDGAVADYGCAGIVCPPQSWNLHGRASSAFPTCRPCPPAADAGGGGDSQQQSLYWGQTQCVTGNTPNTDENEKDDQPKSEREILNELFQATGGRDWTQPHDSWLDPTVPLCERQGLRCVPYSITNEDPPLVDEGGYVSELLLERYGMRGTIPTSIYQLSQLRRLAVSYNPVVVPVWNTSHPTLEVVATSHIWGIVPDWATLLTATTLEHSKVVSIHLAGSGLTGSFVDWLNSPSLSTSSSSLRDLRLSYNALTGTLISADTATTTTGGWKKLAHLESLNLEGNRLHGPLSSSSSFDNNNNNDDMALALPRLQELKLSDNFLSGPLPLTWAQSNWTQSLYRLYVARQKRGAGLTGPLLDFDTFVHLVDLDLSHNQLQGSLSPNFMALVRNSTTVSGPDGIKDYTDQGVVRANLTYNQLEGGIPEEWSSVVPFRVDLSHNQLTEPIPLALCELDEWQQAWDLPNTSTTTTPTNDCDYVLCPPLTISPTGRATATDPCAPCSDNATGAQYYGSTSCSNNPLSDVLPMVTGLQTQRDALMLFYHVTQGPVSWTHRTGWEVLDATDPLAATTSNTNTTPPASMSGTTTPSTAWDICSWHGVVCEPVNGNLSVVELRLESNGLDRSALDMSENDDDGVDPIVAALSQLPDLRLIDFKGNEKLQIYWNRNSIDGGGGDDDPVWSVTSFIWSSLETLRISRTAISSLSGIEVVAPQLTSLHAMDSAQLKAEPFPAELLQLTLLRELYLSFNKFNGTVPADIDKLDQLEQLYLYDNQFQGQLPTSIGSLLQLRELVLGENYFSGTLPTELSQLPNLEQLSIQNQKGRELVHGALPDFAQASNFWYLDISNNDFGPEIPASLLEGSAQLEKPITVLMRNNDFSGTLPPSFERFPTLYIDLADNRIFSVPLSLCDNGDWMNGAVGEIDDTPTGSDGVSHACDTLLCPIGYASAAGRQDTPQRPCTKCPEQDDDQQSYNYQYWGQTKCLGVNDSSSERSILNTFYAATDGKSWNKQQFWGSETPICSWQGVVCSGDLQDDHGVEVLNLASNNLRGTLPHEVVWALPFLRELVLRGNSHLTISFEAMSTPMNDASALEVLDVSYTHVTSLRGLQRAKLLKELYADQAGLYGPFPEEVLSLSNINTVHMNWNFLVGTLPEDIDAISALTFLHLSGNDFHGEIPSSIGNLAKLQELVLDDCLISGALPTELSALPQLRHVSIVRLAKAGRDIAGKLPSFDKVSMLESIGLGGNDLTGSIPDNFLAASLGVQEVVLNHNNLVGSIPDGLASLSELRLAVVDNEISEMSQEFCDSNAWAWVTENLDNATCDAFLCPPGTANDYGQEVDIRNPCATCDASAVAAGAAPFYGSTSCDVVPNERDILVELFQALRGSNWYRNDYWLSKASFCDWYGVACDNGHVISINLDKNKLDGKVPSSIYRLPKLKLLWMSHNAIETTFDGIENAQNLLDLRLESTGLVSVDGLGDGTLLTAVSLAHNDLAGAFPSELLELENIRLLNVGHNALTGPLPDSFDSLRYLRSLQLNDNQLSGPLPAFADSLTLMDLRLSSNQFNGTIPSNFLERTTTGHGIRVDLSSNNLTGEVPPDLARFPKLNLELGKNQLTDLPMKLCEQTEWNNGDVGRFGCDGLVCHPGTSTHEGRQSTNSLGMACVQCSSADPELYGQTNCGGTLYALSSSAPRLLRRSGTWPVLVMLVGMLVIL